MTRPPEAVHAKLSLPENRPLLCAVTDRRSLPGENLAPFLSHAIAAGVDLIQIRERDLPARELLSVVKDAVRQAQTTGTRILVNDRLDVALDAGADGVHLPAQGLPLKEVRRHHPEILAGASTHNLEELRLAQNQGADFAFFGPVFPPLSKSISTAPAGLDALAQAVRAVHIPVLALGGITEENARACLATGAAGLAGITLFQRSENLPETVKRLRGY